MLSEVWDKVKIPTVTSYRIIDKITRLHKEYYGLRKSATRTMGKAMEDRNVFTIKVDNPLDVSRPEEERLVKTKKIMNLSCRKATRGCQGYMSGVDKS